MAATLDRKRPYGTVHGGSGANRTRFEQDGKEFDAAGREIVHAAPLKAQANPGAISIGGSGDYSANHIGTLLLNDGAGIETTYTPFSGTGAATPALLGGHVDALMTYTPMIDQLGDQVRVLAVVTEELLPAFEEYPTFIEQGIDLADGAYRGVSVPLETPQEVIDTLVAAFEEINQDEELVAQFEEQGFVLENIGPEEADELTAERTAVYEELLANLGLR